MYVVTGVSGHVGSAVAELLLEAVPAEQLIFTSRDEAALERWAERGVDVRVADFDDVAATTEAFRGGDALLLISTMLVGPVRRRQHANAIEVARAAGITRIVYTSYLGTDDPANQALVTEDHRFTEQAIFDSGLTWNIMRNSQYAEAMAEQQAAMAITTGQSIGNTGDGAVSFVSRDDVAAVAAALLLGRGEPNTAYDVTGPEALTYREIGELIAEISGRPIEIVDLTDEQMYAMWDAAGVPRQSTGDFSASPVPWCSDDMVSFGANIRAGNLARVTDAVPALTGRPGTRMRDLMVRASAAWPAPPDGAVP